MADRIYLFTPEYRFDNQFCGDAFFFPAKKKGNLPTLSKTKVDLDGESRRYLLDLPKKAKS